MLCQPVVVVQVAEAEVLFKKVLSTLGPGVPYNANNLAASCQISLAGMLLSQVITDLKLQRTQFRRFGRIIAIMGESAGGKPRDWSKRELS